MHHIKSFENIIHAFLICVHRTDSPHIVVIGGNAIFSWKWCQRCHTLQTPQLLWELIFDENSALWRTEISSTLAQLLTIEGLMNDTDARTSINCNSNHARNMIQMSLCEAFGSVKWVNPDNHLLFKKLVRKLIVVVISLWRCHAIDLLHFLEIASISMSLHIVVLNEHFLTNVVLVQLIGHDVWSFCSNLIFDFVFFSNDRRSWVKLTKIVHHCILDMHVNLCENILSIVIVFLFHRYVGKTRCFSHAVNDFIRAFQKLNTCGHELIQFNHSLHF